MWICSSVALCLVCAAFALALRRQRVGRRAAPGSLAVDREQFFHLLVDSSIDLITVIDRAGVILYDNPAVLQTLGYSQAEQRGRSVLEFIHPDDQSIVVESLARLQQALARHAAEFRFRHKDGSWRWLASVATNRLDEPAVAGIVVTSRDITAQKEAERALFDSEQRFRQSFDAAPTGMALLTPEGRCLSANRALCDLLGYSDEEMRQFDFRDVTHPDDIGASEACYRKLANEGLRTYALEKRYLCSDGQAVWVHLHATVIHGHDGKPSQVVAQIQDVTEQRQADVAVRDAERRFRQLTENIDEVFWIVSPADRTVHYVSPAYEKIWGRPRQELLEDAAAWLDTVHPDDRENLLGKAPHLGGSDRYEAEFRIIRPDGAVRWILDRGFPVLDESGRVYRCAGVAQDITERKEREEQVSKLMAAVQQSPAAVVVTDPEGRIEFVNPKFEEMTGYTAEEAIGRTPRILHSGEHDREFFRAMWRTILAGETWRGEICNRRKDGTLYWESASISAVRNSRGKITNYVAVKEDVTPRKQAEARIAEMAFHDSLTGLPNRRQLQDRLEDAVRQARRRRELVALHYLDLDRFKVVNDTLGHAVGDALLIAVGDRLRGCIRETDTAARIGGDEFAVLQQGLRDQQGAETFAQRVLEAMAPPFELAGRHIHISPSIGVSVFPLDSNGPQQLLQHADMAMYLAKKEGRNNMRFFTENLYAQVRDKMALESDMHAALAKNEFFLHYQPQVNLRTHRIIGIEALVRWQHPTRGLVPPDQFVSLAEECGLIGELSRWVLEHACRQNAAWQTAGLPKCRIAVNISPADFKRGDLCDVVADVLLRTGLAPQFLELEVTETMLLHDEQVLEAVPKLKNMGVAMSIDDFGTGYSSLNYLRRLPVNKLKIDQSFIRGLPGSADDAIIAGAIVELGHALGLSVIAEGIETKEQILCLRAKGCDEGQGYFFGRPMSGEALQSLLRSERRQTAGHRTELAL